MEQAELAQRLKKLLVERVGVTEAKITPDASLADDLGLDSLDGVELAMAMEEEFDLQIDDKELRGLTTVGEALNFVQQRLVEKPAV